MLRSSLAVFGCLIAALSASAARSQMLPTPTICKTYFASEKPIPAEVTQAIARFQGWGRSDNAADSKQDRSSLPGIAIEKCQNADVFRSYHLLLPPKARDGVCYFADFDISPLIPKSREFVPNDGKRALEKHTFRMMSENGACKSQKDAGYIFTRGVTPGVFRKIVDFWREAASSQAALQKAMAVHPNDEFERKDLARFLAMMHAHIGHLPRIRSVDISAGEFPPLEEPYCLLIFDDPASSNQSWEIDVDFSPDGLKIFRVGNWIA